MRYNRSNKEIDITITDLCGQSNRNDQTFDIEELMNKTVDTDLELKQLCFKYEYNAIVYSLNLAMLVCDNVICEVSLSDNDIKTPPISYKTLVEAYAYCSTHGLKSLDIKTVIINSNGDIKGTTVRRKNEKALEAFFVRKLSDKEPIAIMLKQRGESVLSQGANIKFPYASFRRGQKTMIKECYAAMKQGNRLFVQAPTGIGKTISVLYPAVRLVGEGKCDKIFYLTAKSSVQNEIFKTAGVLFEAGACLRTIVISAKDQICLCKELMIEGVCDSVHCKYSKASDENIRGAVNALLSLQNGYEKNIIAKVAREWGICPYELSLALAEYCEIIIADYNYVFDPLVYFRRFFDDGDRTDKYLFLIDEAHNLADRTREMYSAELSDEMFYNLLHDAQNMIPELSESVCSVIKEIKYLKELCSDNLIRDEQSGAERGYYISRNHYESLDIRLEELYELMLARLKSRIDESQRRALLPLYRVLCKYLVVTALCPDSSMFYCEVDGERIMFKNICIDPSSLIDMRMQKAYATLLFSATLTPIDYFMDILGGGPRARSLTIKSPFDEDNLFIAAIDDISTRYEDREKSLSRVISYIAATVSCKKGNYMVYFPSYNYMTRAADMFGKKYPKVKLMVQKRKMTREEKANYLNEFRLGDDKMRVGFCVLGGGFSEGIDLPGSNLIGVVVVGVGTPGLSSERNIMRDYFDITREAGYHYAYTYPGMNNVLQAAGRVIRSDTDSGVVVLIDDRYATAQYKSMYPEHWGKMKRFDQPISLNSAAKAFWADIYEKNAKNND